jgi:pimeloyl-ACP methyl ester carboxylesterase
MPYATLNGVRLYYEVHGTGFPLLFCHEFAGDYRSWKAQVKFFRRHYQVIVYNARGYAPSDIPGNLSAYTQELCVEDALALLTLLGMKQAHVVGFSMGGSVALNFALAHPDAVRSLVVAGVGTGSVSPNAFRQRVGEFADRLDKEGIAALADYPRGPERVQLLRKSPQAWQEFGDHFLGQSPMGLAQTLRGVLGRRPSILDLEPGLRALDVPTLIMVGDEDGPCLEVAVFLKRVMSRSGLVVFPQSGHTINLEEPDRFNTAVLDFLKAAEEGRWPRRDEGVKSATLAP